MVMNCMNVHINIPIATQTPHGIIQPFRNLSRIFVGRPRPWHAGKRDGAELGKRVGGTPEAVK
jgi:hypothetical protein